MKIVSLLPSATEIVCALGLEGQLVGVTHECDWPPAVRELPRVTKTLIPHDATSAEIDALVRERLKTDLALYTLDMAVLESLAPDLIVTQALCDVCAVAEAEVLDAACRLPGNPRVINLEPMSLDDVLSTLTMVGEATDRVAEARAVVGSLRERIERVRHRTALIPPSTRPRVAFLEWIDPPFCTGHWNPTLVEIAGGVDILGEAGKPSHTLAWSDVVQSNADVVFIACCGFARERAVLDLPIAEGQTGWSDLPAVRSGRVYVADGNAYFSRPGPRLVDSLELLAHTLHPDIHPLPSGIEPALAPLKTARA